MSIATKVRFVLNWLIPVALSGIYGTALLDPKLFFAEGRSAVEAGSDPAELWSKMSPSARAIGPQLGGWVLCYVFIVAGFLFFENTQRTHQLMARLQAVIMLVLWPIIWYGAMASNKDFAPMDAALYFKQMSLGETILGLGYAYCGFFVDGEEEKKES